MQGKKCFYLENDLADCVVPADVSDRLNWELFTKLHLQKVNRDLEVFQIIKMGLRAIGPKGIMEPILTSLLKHSFITTSI